LTVGDVLPYIIKMAKYHKMADNDGFGDEASPPYVADAPPQRWRLKVGSDGRLVIPAAARAAMELGQDGVVNATLEDGQLRLTSIPIAIKRAQAFAKKHRKGSGSLVDALIAERREAAKRGD
jgi:bifunctional DNA-binding transcriptional regulator/antitoxin component of YhaV-PrlF toxin-antitoxin module